MNRLDADQVNGWIRPPAYGGPWVPVGTPDIGTAYYGETYMWETYIHLQLLILNGKVAGVSCTIDDYDTVGQKLDTVGFSRIVGEQLTGKPVGDVLPIVGLPETMLADYVARAVHAALTDWASGYADRKALLPANPNPPNPAPPKGLRQRAISKLRRVIGV